jgi:hypothetical protein
MPRSHPSASQPLRVVVCSLVGLASGLANSGSLPPVPSTVLSTLVLAGGANVGGRLRHSSPWRGRVGFAAGSLVGTGWTPSVVLKEKPPTTALGVRATVVLLMLSAGAFAALVTLTAVHAGLAGARAFSSRLSTSLTILAVCLAAPGWLCHPWRQHRRLRRRPLAPGISPPHDPR